MVGPDLKRGEDPAAEGHFFNGMRGTIINLGGPPFTFNRGGREKEGGT